MTGTFPCGYIGQGSVMIGTVEVIDPAGGNRAVLDSPQRG